MLTMQHLLLILLACAAHAQLVDLAGHWQGAVWYDCNNLAMYDNCYGPAIGCGSGGRFGPCHQPITLSITNSSSGGGGVQFQWRTVWPCPLASGCTNTGAIGLVNESNFQVQWAPHAARGDSCGADSCVNECGTNALPSCFFYAYNSTAHTLTLAIDLTMQEDESGNLTRTDDWMPAGAASPRMHVSRLRNGSAPASTRCPANADWQANCVTDGRNEAWQFRWSMYLKRVDPVQ